ncbi:Protein of unknown function (DUF421) [Streptoalloteichus tenebrarius]|uniref:YetF C-terminal domain-containing protein n=2 Tax=Streptoalloteichus tenebrarius (strain ATCC 17920 / DSM 40477 / JCM 4838 / CBS 697.72 / NBRC 16177 / NCIMB 11028 / NRRL B-12390 / A12253. 1 / ISP 5477) TaxID=1933 RepID=A0ABT1HUL2_STRSD|nr:Protein of unknown function (DUF421) [Streptoalloteichus tenebrarius]
MVVGRFNGGGAGNRFAMDWSSVFVPDTPLLEIFIRGTVMYLVIYFLLRLVFKRQAGTTAITDLLVIVLLADAAQNGMAGDYKAVPDGLLLVSVIVFWALVLDAAAWRFPKVEKIVKPRPLLLIRNGRLMRENMARELLTELELFSQLREQGVTRLADVWRAQMEPDGRLSVITQSGRGKRPHNRGERVT